MSVRGAIYHVNVRERCCGRNGPHLFSLALKFPLIHGKQAQSKENKRPLSRLNKNCKEDEAATQGNNEDKTVRIIPNSGRSRMGSGLFCRDKDSTSDVFVFNLAAVTNSISS